ncbi:MAG: helix-turn-helix domain-containing protein [Terracidiphilus sp.]
MIGLEPNWLATLAALVVLKTKKTGVRVRNSEINFNIPKESTDTVPSNSRRMKILDASEAAAILRMDSRTLICWARLGHIPAHPLGEGKRRLWRFIEEEILDWFEQRTQVQKRPPARSIDSAIGARARRSA